MTMGSINNKLRKKTWNEMSTNSEKREVTRKSKEFKATDGDVNSNQSDETILENDQEESFTRWYTAIDV